MICDIFVGIMVQCSTHFQTISDERFDTHWSDLFGVDQGRSGLAGLAFDRDVHSSAL